MARISTHVLDTARGKPAAGIPVQLHLWRDGERRLLRTVPTNADGRTDEPLLAGERIETGVYELVFCAGAYLRASVQALPEPLFLEDVVVRFGVSDPSGNYHVPLLLSTYGYSTYRGS